TKGADGGRSPSMFSAGGIAAAPITAANLALRGGCPGEDGAKGTASAGIGGAGGGALALIARTSITVTGVINASGAGGQQPLAANGAGGGGGGAGGLISLDATAIDIEIGAQCFANGGGGDEGSGVNIGKPGDVSPTPTMAAAGGSGGSQAGGDGGRGATRTVQPGTGLNGTTVGGSDTGGGGGGGGSYGYIVLSGTNLQIDPVAVSPIPTQR
ncbi:MAG TPA: hypothetical protein VGC42_02720, partial [Kofleriaceae bacterium]